MDSKSFYTKSTAIFFILTAIYGVIRYFNWLPTHPHTIFILLYHFLLTIASYGLVIQGSKKGGLDAVNYMMGNSALRLLVSGGVLLAYFYFVKENLISFTITFFVAYLFYTVFEINTLLSKLRQISAISDENNEKNT